MYRCICVYFITIQDPLTAEAPKLCRANLSAAFCQIVVPITVSDVLSALFFAWFS